ncbi:energy transducer TonB, partial [Bacteroides nordii]|nr:energy transducer TonB [Bacteroides nordii]
EGKLVAYYPDGKLRREESYQNDKCTDGKLLAAEGNELPFEPYFVAPEFPGAIDALAKLLKDILAYALDAVRAITEGNV